MTTKYMKKLSSFCYQSNANMNETFFSAVKRAERFLLADSTQPGMGVTRQLFSGITPGSTEW